MHQLKNLMSKVNTINDFWFLTNDFDQILNNTGAEVRSVKIGFHAHMYMYHVFMMLSDNLLKFVHNQHIFHTLACNFNSMDIAQIQPFRWDDWNWCQFLYKAYYVNPRHQQVMAFLRNDAVRRREWYPLATVIF